MFALQLASLLLIACGALAQSCENLGDSTPYSKINAYYDVPGYAITLDADKRCLQPYYRISTCYKLSNPKGNKHLVMQPDGNAVIYGIGQGWGCNLSLGVCTKPVWNTQTWNKPGAYITVQDGRFLVYDASNQIIWGTNAGSPRTTQLCMQNDGNLVLYDNGRAIWDSKTY
ncbi:hypothetical protein BCR33DRAFT_722579 [Rhizoclosmatium globosum]|uniref:Bulb-type lectin domain-containing protein n=1 Tax=Rhizoclosmatium globosum TaxID=329046 RepID=A0A1Y2BKU0_9FUNG|nr:hypothetical protein BCR33DRAFT_722579 [Rhizoclosmatium globosum]|eukprot:ORY35240.1 hypothetical protein BCR33DRAFT_722579 [Rhizoclosmatium globosum]